MLYIMRHGETDWNKEGRVQGQTDNDINDAGIQSAKEVALKYKNLHFDVCYCSPLIRAKHTAEIFLEGKDTPIILDKRLMEMNFGKIEGVTLESVAKFGYRVDFVKSLIFNKGIEDGESVEQVIKRVTEALDDIKKSYNWNEKNVLIVAHGVLNSAIIHVVKNYSFEECWKLCHKNAELIELL